MDEEEEEKEEKNDDDDKESIEAKNQLIWRDWRCSLLKKVNRTTTTTTWRPNLAHNSSLITIQVCLSHCNQGELC